MIKQKYGNLMRRKDNPVWSVDQKPLSKGEKKLVNLVETHCYRGGVAVTLERIKKLIQPILSRSKACARAQTRAREEYKGKDQKKRFSLWKKYYRRDCKKDALDDVHSPRDA